MVLYSVLRIRDVYPGYRIRIFSIPDPRSRTQGQKDFRIPDPDPYRIKEFNYFISKKCYQAFGNKIRDVHPGSGSWFFNHPGSRLQGVKKESDPGSGSATMVLFIFRWVFNIWLSLSVNGTLGTLLTSICLRLNFTSTHVSGGPFFMYQLGV